MLEPSSSSSASFHHREMNSDVFLSCSGEDGCVSFITDLGKALVDMGLVISMDNKTREMGDKLAYMLENVIRSSRYSIVVLSKGYVSSKRCLREFAKIMDCMVGRTQQVVPVFYYVHRSDVQTQWAESFDEHGGMSSMVLPREEKQKHLKEVQWWRTAMKKISTLPGFVVTKTSHQLDVIKKITKHIFCRLRPKLVAPPNKQYENLVEMSLQFGRMNMLSGLESKEYNVEVLHNNSAFLLFCQKTFGDDESFMNFKKEIVKKVAGGQHPQALIELGSSFYGQSLNVSEGELKCSDKLVLENISLDVMKTSYGRLDADSQQIFLDLACFFNGRRVDRVIDILKGFGYSSPNVSLQLLVERCLIHILNEKIWMHDLILRIGREIAQQGKQTRVWLREDVRRIFHEENGVQYIQGIVVDLDEEEEEVALQAQMFTYMTGLKILEISKVQLSEDIEFLSNRLRLLNWHGYPSDSLPSNFQAPNLLEIHLLDSKLERLWDGKKRFESLKEIDVSDSEFLVETPDFSNVPKLQRLILRNCTRLYVVHPSINSLSCLVLLDMEGCISLRSFPSNVLSCISLETLTLSNSESLESFPEIEEGCMQHLTQLHLDASVIKTLNPSIGSLTGLVLLDLRNCTELSSLPSEIGSLRSLQALLLNGCKSLNKIPSSLENLESLEELDIGGTSITHAPQPIHSLRNLKILNCEGLSSRIWHSLTALCSNDVWSLRDLNLSNCDLEDEDIPKDLRCLSSLEILDLSGNHFVWLSQSLNQLTNLKALYLNDCTKLQQVPRLLPSSLQYVGGDKSLNMLQNCQDSFMSTSSSSPTNAEYQVDNLFEGVAEEQYSPKVDSIIVQKMRKQIVGQNLVGMQDQLEELHNLLSLEESNDILFVAIFGMGGIGKTTIAEIVYIEIVDKFESSCFLHISKQSDLVSLQRQLLSQLMSKEVKILDEDYGAQTIKNHVSGKRILIVLDGVDESRQIEKLVGSPDWFYPGSRVIITTRDRNVLHHPIYGDKMVEYSVKLLDHARSFMIFCNHAFEGAHVDRNLEVFGHDIVEKIGGIPLALRIIGSFLRSKDLAIWEETLMSLDKYEQNFFDAISLRSLTKEAI